MTGPAAPRPGLRRRLPGLWRDRRGVSAVEFAILLPLMITLFFGGHEVGQAITIYRKVSHTSAVLGDLVAQVSSITSAEVENVFDASVSIMSPYSATGAKMMVAAVKWDSTTSSWKIKWVKTRNGGGTGWTANGSPPTGKAPPDGLKSTTQGVIVSQVEYTYTTGFKTLMQDIWGEQSINLGDIAYLRPRISNEVELK